MIYHKPAKVNKDKHYGKPLLHLLNAHVDGCGAPPKLMANGYTLSYYENKHGEQWVFVWNDKTGKGYIQGGDCGWMQKFAVSVKSPKPRCVLSQGETLWLMACLISANYHISLATLMDNWDKQVAQTKLKLAEKSSVRSSIRKAVGRVAK